MKKTFENEDGNILVRYSPNTQFGRCGIVEMLHLYDKNTSGCVIGAWKITESDGQKFPVFYAIHDRFTLTKYSFDIMEAVKYGQKLAEVCLESE